jgi:hypothetical protein
MQLWLEGEQKLTQTILFSNTLARAMSSRINLICSVDMASSILYKMDISGTKLPILFLCTKIVFLKKVVVSTAWLSVLLCSSVSSL